MRQIKKICFLIPVFIIILFITSCGFFNNENGTYYLYKNEKYDKTDYITLKSGKWTSSDETEGTYKTSGKTIKFYVDLFGETEEWQDGSISDGVITLEILDAKVYYCKEGKKPTEENNPSGDKNPSNTTKEEFTITYNANGGSFAGEKTIETQKAEKDALLTAPASPTRDNYNFAGWATSSSGNTLWNFATDKVTKDMTLYAKWTQESATILSMDGASIEGNSIYMLVKNSIDSVSLSDKVVCSADSTWKLYYDKLGQIEIPTKIAVGQLGSLSAGENIFYIVVTSSNNTQTKVYELNIHRSYKIKISYYHKNTLLKTDTTDSGYTYEINYKPNIPGYTFKGWKDSTGVELKKLIPYKDMTLQADATANQYTLTYDVNGGNTLTSKTKVLTYDSNYSLLVPTRTGYTFDGWYYNSTKITNEKGECLNVWQHSNNITVTAKWIANAYTLSLDQNIKNAGSISGAGSYDYDKSVTIRATSNFGYNFSGWYDDKNNLISDQATYSFKMGFDTTYTAKFEIANISLHYVVNGEVFLTETYTIDTPITTLKTYETDDVFFGWYSNENFDTTDTKVTSTRNLVGKNNEVKIYGGTSNGSVGFSLKYSNDSYYISSVSEVRGEVKFPTTFNGKTVTKMTIGNKFKSNNQITSITIPEGETSISSSAFNDCYNLKNVVIPNSVTSIGLGAFQYCSSLTSITIPFVGASLNGTCNINFNNIYLGYIFGATSGSGDYNSQSGTFSNGNKARVPRSLKEVIITGGTSIGYNAFYECSSLTSITIPASVTSIGQGAFYKCSSLENVYYEGAIEDWCNISLDDDDSNPMYYASHFYLRNSNNEWEEVTSIEIPNTITKIGANQFYGFSNVTSITIPASVTSIGEYAFRGCSSLTSITIPNSVTSIGEYAFRGCSSLTSITIPNSVTSIREYAFYNCSSLENVYYEGAIEDWCNISLDDDDPNPMYYASHFYLRNSNNEWEEVTSIEIPNTITKIGANQFYGFSNVTSITIPASVTSIGEYAFRGGSSLTSITIPNSVTSIRKSAFHNCSSLTSITIPNSVTSIREYAFRGCSSLTSITIPNSVTSIGEYAFYNCSSLTSITIPNCVTSIGEYAFGGCASLTIYCEATSKPNSWSNQWNYSNCPVYWYSETEPTTSGN